MKLNKKQIGLIAGLACVIVLIVLLLTMCSGNGDHQGVPAEPTQATADTAATEAVTEEATEASEETTEATEETEETEETTEETEATTTPTTGNTKPGGSGGYVPGSGNNDDDDDSAELETEKAPAAGSKESPYMETVTQLPDGFFSVTVPAEGSIYQLVYGAEGGVLTIEDIEAHVVYNDVTYEPDEYGVIRVPFEKATVETDSATEPTAESPEDGEASEETEEETLQVPVPQLFQLCSKSVEERSFYLSFQAPLGSAENPEILEAVDGMVSIETTLEAGDEDGYWFGYMTESGCRLTLQLDFVTENVNCDVIVTVGETVQKLSEAEENTLVVDVPAWETALIQVIAVPDESGNYPAAEVRVLCNVEDTSGTKENPIMYYDEFPIVTDVLEPKTEVYYSVFGVGGMILSVADPDAYVVIGEETWKPVDGVISGEVVAANPREPVVIGIGNGGEEPKSFTVEFQYKLGNMMNPAPLLTDAPNTAVIAAGGFDGYWYTWTAQEDGILSITMPDGSWMYQINQITDFIYGDTIYSDAEDASNLVEMEVDAGDELSIMVCTYDPTNPFETPAGEVVFEAIFSTKSGTKDNPMWLFELENTIEIKPGESFYCNHILAGVTMEVTGEGSFTVTYNGVNYPATDGRVTIPNVSGSRFEPIPMILTNYGAETTQYTVTYVYPLGSITNPEHIELMGQYTAAIAVGGESYFYTWTAPSDGQFTLSVQDDDWSFVMDNLTTYVYGEIHSSSDGSESSETITVAAGDQIQIRVSTASGKTGDVVFELDFYDPTYGTVENPVALWDMENVVTVRPGTQVYTNVVMSNVTMTITAAEEFAVNFKGLDYVSENGVVIIHGVDANRWTPLPMIISHSGENTIDCTITFAYPLGSSMNPHEITQMTEYTVSVVGDGEGYFFKYVAENDGVFVITMLSNDWAYSVNNLTAYVYGDVFASNSGAQSTQIVDVKAGDEIQINIGTASRQNKDVTLEFDAYDPTVGIEENPLWLSDLEYSLVVRPGAPVYCNLVHNGVVMTVTGDVTVTLNGKGYPAVNGVVTVPNVEASRNMPASLVLTNSGDRKTTCTVSFAYPAGTMMNPEVMTDLGVYSAAVSQDGMGYFFSWTAEKDGKFTITMLEDDWIYMLQKQSGDSYEYSATNYSNFGDPSGLTMDVLAGDVITINIGTASGEEKMVPLEISFQEAAEVEEIQIFTGSYVPKQFEVLPEEILQMDTLDLCQSYELTASKAGIYKLDTESSPLLLVDFTDDTYINLAELVEREELLIPVEAADGTITYQRCNELLEAYIECAWVIEVSEEVTRTLYPLTQDLELILKALGEQFGWFDVESDGYLFGAKTEESETEPQELEEKQPEQESMWLFACSYIEFNMSEEVSETSPLTETASEEEASA